MYLHYKSDCCSSNRLHLLQQWLQLLRKVIHRRCREEFAIPVIHQQKTEENKHLEFVTMDQPPQLRPYSLVLLCYKQKQSDPAWPATQLVPLANQLLAADFKNIKIQFIYYPIVNHTVEKAGVNTVTTARGNDDYAVWAQQCITDGDVLGIL